MFTNEKNLRKSIRISVMMLFAFCMLVQGTVGNVAARGTSGGSTVILGGTPPYLTYRYVDSAGNEIAASNSYEVDEEDYTEYEVDGQVVTKSIPVKFKEIPGYEYAGCKATAAVTGRELVLRDGLYIDASERRSEDVEIIDSVHYRTYIIELKYQRSLIDYSFNVNYVDTTNKTIKDAYSENIQGADVSFTPATDAIEGYEYKGYYYTNMSGEVGAFSKGSADELLTDSNPVITTQSDGKDAENGAGTYNITVVYSETPSPTPTETPSPTPTPTPVEEKYKVTYDVNGGTGSAKDQNEYAANATVTILTWANIAREGYVFTSWNTKADGSGDSYAWGEEFVITEDTTFYAQWMRIEDIRYKVTYDANGGKGSVTDDNAYELYDIVTVMSGENLSRAGYTFTGWNTEKDGSGQACEVDGKYKILSDVTLYAQWKEGVADDDTDDNNNKNNNNTNTNNTSRPTYSSSTGAKGTAASVKTGDQSTMMIYVVSILAAVFVGAVAFYQRKKAGNK